MENCIFCKIVRKELKTNIAYEDEKMMAFYDINPQAPFHLLLIPKKHITDILSLEDKDIIGEMILKIKELTKDISQNGFRIVINCGKDSGCEVFHLHIHILGGRRLNWPPG
ncbi:MAG: histidine triad nucleotide-binding protein [bacterium]